MSALLCPLATSMPLLIGPLADDRSDWRKRVSGNYRKCHPIHLVIKVDTLVTRTEISVFFTPFRPSIHLFSPEARDASKEDQPQVQGAVAARAQEGLEELSHAEGQEGQQ